MKFIIFDLDGTLVDSREDIIRAVNFTLKKIGLKEKPPAEISSYIGAGVRELLRKSTGDKSQDLLKKAVSIYEKYYREHYLDNTTLYPNVKKTLGCFNDRRKAIVTNRSLGSAMLILKALDIFSSFEHIIGGDDPACMKPGACPLNRIMRGLNIQNRQEAIMVGDMDIDILAGRRAGIVTCAVTYGIGKKADIMKAKPDYIIDDLMELTTIID